MPQFNDMMRRVKQGDTRETQGIAVRLNIAEWRESQRDTIADGAVWRHGCRQSSLHMDVRFLACPVCNGISLTFGAQEFSQ